MDALEERRDEIPHAYHWGQNLPINDTRIVGVVNGEAACTGTVIAALSNGTTRTVHAP